MNRNIPSYPLETRLRSAGARLGLGAWLGPEDRTPFPERRSAIDIPLKPEYQPIAPQPLFCLSFQPFGRIAIANCDAADNAMTEASLGEAYRAVREVVGG